jgi:hypothetical protein
MRFAIALSLVAAAFVLAPGAVSAAPFVLSNHAAVTQELNDSAVELVARRSKKARRHQTRKRRCAGTCKRPWYPYQYRYWKFYFPFGGPLF